MPATSDHFSNFATSTVAYGAAGVGTAFKSTDTQLTLKTGDGAKFPSTTPFMVELGGAPFSPELTKCTAINGDTLTLLRAQEGTSAQTWNIGTGVSCVVTAGSLSDLWTRVQKEEFDVTDFGATGNGVTDDTAAVQAAITAACVSGGRVFIPAAMTCKITATLVINADNVEVVGEGWSSQLLAGTTNFTMLQVQGPGGSGNFRYGIRIANLFFNGNNLTGVMGLDLISTYAALLDHLRLRYITGTNILMDGISGAFGAYNYIRNCFITDGGATAIGIQTNDSEWLTIQGGHIGYFQSGGGNTAVGVQVQNLNCVIDGVQFDYNDTAVQVKFAGRTAIQGCQFDRGWTHFVYLNDTSYNTVANCFFGVHEGTATDLIFVDGAGNSGNVVNACTVETSSGWTNFINEGSGIAGYNTYTNNITGLLPISLRSGIARGNVGYNPRGMSMTQPGVPSTGSAFTNSYGIDAMVAVSGGTVSNIAVGGTNTGLTAGTFRVPALQTIALTYTGTPTWHWYGD